jgi:hypothetical protein
VQRAEKGEQRGERSPPSIPEGAGHRACVHGGGGMNTCMDDTSRARVGGLDIMTNTWQA